MEKLLDARFKEAPQAVINDFYKQANLPLVTQRLYGEAAGRDVLIYGRIWTYIESSLTFAATTFQAVAFFVKDLALTLIALLPAVISSDARRFVSAHVAHMMQDLVAIPIGLVGTISPHAGNFLAKTAMNVFISLFHDAKLAAGMKAVNNNAHFFARVASDTAGMVRLGVEAEALQKQKDEIAVKISELEAAEGDHAEEIAGLEKELQELTVKEEKLGKEGNALQSHIEALQAKGNAAISLEIAQAKLARTEAKLAALDPKAEGYSADKSKLEDRKGRVENSIKRSERELASAEAKLNPPAVTTEAKA
jgi:hypothetical protein